MDRHAHDNEVRANTPSATEYVKPRLTKLDVSETFGGSIGAASEFTTTISTLFISYYQYTTSPSS